MLSEFYILHSLVFKIFIFIRTIEEISSVANCLPSPLYNETLGIKDGVDQIHGDMMLGNITYELLGVTEGDI